MIRIVKIISGNITIRSLIPFFMAKHHIVQEKYLVQWRIENTVNHLNTFIISENRCEIGNTKTKLFWRKDFNILDDNGKKSYLPENVSAVIDSKGIEAIRKIYTGKRSQLDGMDRRSIAFYTALQYIRTPRFREESDKMINAQIKYFMREDVLSPDKVKITKEEILKHKPENKRDKEVLEKIREMPEEEIQNQIFESIHGNNIAIHLTKTGHSKSVIKVAEQAKELFEFQWLFFVARQDTSFVTSDNPCFAIGSKIMNGLLSPRSMVFFPLRPDLCICIKPSNKTQVESFIDLDEQGVRDINLLILSHSYQCLVAKTKEQLVDLTKDFDHRKHRKSRDVVVSKKGPYTMFNLE